MTASISLDSDDLDLSYMIRPCELYKEEYNDCASLKGRFHQYFIFGETVDCSQWKKDFNNCTRWTTDKNIKALKEVIESENQRRLKRLEAHFKNDVWEKRHEPPDDWEKPLPDWMQKEHENTYLDHKSKELKGESFNNTEGGRTMCVLS